MYRKALKDLISWKNNPERKPLILEGARQVGKTWLLREFGKKYYEKVAYVNLEQDEVAKTIFDGSFEVDRIVSRLSIHLNMDIDEKDTLIVVDEVQENPRALTSLKYFYEDAPKFNIVVAGSLLGITLHNEVSFPVGKVEYLKIHPMTFYEFLLALGKDKIGSRLIAGDFEAVSSLHDELLEYWRQYVIVGGMPEVVKAFIEDKSLLKAREIQGRIINDYERDFSKHAKKFDVPKILEIYNSIPSFLAKENKKFMFGAIKPSARAREYESALLWLVDAGLAGRVCRVSKIATPLRTYRDSNAFKLFMSDIGLLGCMAGLHPESLYNEEDFVEFKGAICEQYVFQEMHANGIEEFYYSTDDSRMEIDFVCDLSSGICPIEVKSGKNLSSPSLNRLLESHEKMEAIKISMLPYLKNERIVNMPIYGVSNLK